VEESDADAWVSDILGVVVLMLWLLIGLLISVGALLFVAGAVTRRILRQRRPGSDIQTEKPADETVFDVEPDSQKGEE
jgi:hypothetical protein